MGDEKTRKTCAPSSYVRKRTGERRGGELWRWIYFQKEIVNKMLILLYYIFHIVKLWHNQNVCILLRLISESVLSHKAVGEQNVIQGRSRALIPFLTMMLLRLRFCAQCSATIESFIYVISTPLEFPVCLVDWFQKKLSTE